MLYILFVLFGSLVPPWMEWRCNCSNKMLIMDQSVRQAPTTNANPEHKSPNA